MGSPAKAVGGNVTVPKGSTVPDAVAIGGSITVDGTVDGDAVAIGGSVYLNPETTINGDVLISF